MNRQPFIGQTSVEHLRWPSREGEHVPAAPAQGRDRLPAGQQERHAL